MNKNDYLNIVEKQIKYSFDHKTIRRELENHIEDTIEELLRDGHTQEEAEKFAVEMMGDPIETGKQLNKVHSPLLGYILLTTRLILGSLICLIVLQTFSLYEETLIMLAPINEGNFSYEQKISLNIKIDTGPTYLIIDNLYKKGNEYKLTYRSFKDFTYSRSPWHTTQFWLKQSEDSLVFDTSSAMASSLLGDWGYYTFMLDQDDTDFMIITRTHDKVTIDLKEYVYEQKE